MEKFILKPSIDMHAGIRVTKDTEFEYKNDKVDQKLKDLVFKSIIKVTGECYESEYHTTIELKEGDILIFEEEGRGYIKPVQELVTVAEAIEELEYVKGWENDTCRNEEESTSSNRRDRHFWSND